MIKSTYVDGMVIKSYVRDEEVVEKGGMGFYKVKQPKPKGLGKVAHSANVGIRKFAGGVAGGTIGGGIGATLGAVVAGGSGARLGGLLGAAAGSHLGRAAGAASASKPKYRFQGPKIKMPKMKMHL